MDADSETREMLEKLLRLEIRNAYAIERAKAQVLMLGDLLLALRPNLEDAERADIRQQIDRVRERYATQYIALLHRWLVEENVRAPDGDDPWWDTPDELDRQ